MTFDFKQIIDNISNIEGLENTTILKTLKEFEKYLIENAVKGDTGERGPQGPTGPEGPAGPRGPKGESGAALNSFEFTPDTNGASYSDEQMTMTGKLRFSILVNGQPQYTTINATIKTNITGSEDIIFDANEDGTAIEIHLDNEVRNKLAKALVTPMSAPTSTELVGINSNNAQIGIAIGEGLTLLNNTLSASGGGGTSDGLSVKMLEFNNADALVNKLVEITNTNPTGLLKLSIKSQSAKTAQFSGFTMSTSGVSAFTSSSRTQMFGDYWLDFLPSRKDSSNNFVFTNANQYYDYNITTTLKLTRGSGNYVDYTAVLTTRDTIATCGQDYFSASDVTFRLYYIE